MSDNQYASHHFRTDSDEAQYLLDSSRATEAKYIALARERARQQSEAEAAGNAAAALIDAERRLSEQRSEPELRDALASAIDEYGYALHQVGIAESNVDRAKQHMDSTDAKLAADYADLDERITAHHVAQIKQRTDHPLPAALQAAESQRGQLVDRIAANHRVHSTLVSELQEAERHLAECTAHRSRAASHVIGKALDAVANEMNAAMDQATALRRKLVSAGSVWIPTSDGSAPVGLSAKAREAVWRQLPDVHPDTSHVDAIREWHARLTNNASATYEPDA